MSPLRNVTFVKGEKARRKASEHVHRCKTGKTWLKNCEPVHRVIQEKI